MINITARAKQALQKLLTANVDLAEGRLRLVDRGQGKLGLGVDIEMPVMNWWNMMVQQF